MTDKEQIIIDGCNVLKCRYYQYKTLKDCEMRYPESGDCEIGLINYLFNGNLDMEKLCVDNPNCIFKQLARKTQECENLKSEEKYLKQCCEKAGEELAKHSFDYDGKEKNLVVQAMELNEKYEKLEKALEEIVGIAATSLSDDHDPAEGLYGEMIKILDIISKAKGREDEHN